MVFCGEVSLRSLVSHQATLYELPEQEEKRSVSVRIRFYLRFISNTSCCLSVRLLRNFTNAGLFGEKKKCCFVFYICNKTFTALLPIDYQTCGRFLSPFFLSFCSSLFLSCQQEEFKLKDVELNLRTARTHINSSHL